MKDLIGPGGGKHLVNERFNKTRRGESIWGWKDLIREKHLRRNAFDWMKAVGVERFDMMKHLGEERI